MMSSVETKKVRGSRWRRRLTLLRMRPGRAMVGAELVVFALWLGVVALSWALISNGLAPHSAAGAADPDRQPRSCSSPISCPAMGLLVLIARPDRARAGRERSPLGGRGGLHVRLVALFSVLAARCRPCWW